MLGQEYLQAPRGKYKMAWIEFAELVTNIELYAYLVLFLMAVYYFWQFIKGPGNEPGKAAWGFGKSFTDRVQIPFIGKQARRRSKTRLLNEYLEEQKETDLLRAAVQEAEYAYNAVKQVIAAKEIKNVAVRDQLVRVVESVKTGLEAVKTEYRRLNRKTWRQERAMGPILEKMRNEGMDVNDMIVLEKSILKGHKECAEIIDDVLTHYGDIKDSIEAVRKIPEDQFSYKLMGNDNISPHIIKLEQNLKDDIYKLKEAFDKQEKTDKDVQGIISKSKNLWS